MHARILIEKISYQTFRFKNSFYPVFLLIRQVKSAMSNRTGEIEEIIIQGLGHRERRNILKIISLTEEGAVYSEILGELGLNTGRMNYHLRQLGGLVERKGDRRYHLTPLGKKALSVLHSMTEDLGNGYEEYLSSARVTQSGGIATWVNRWFYLFLMLTFSAMLGLVAFIRTGVTAGMLPQASYYYLAGFTLLVIVLLVWFRRWVRDESERAQDWWNSLLDRLTGRYR
jgi:predicted transcriptional regulator